MFIYPKPVVLNIIIFFGLFSCDTAVHPHRRPNAFSWKWIYCSVATIILAAHPEKPF